MIKNIEKYFDFLADNAKNSIKRDKKSLRYMSSIKSLLNINLNKVKIVHIAGSKGKGSSSSFVAIILSEHRYKTGLYTSPHVNSYLERFQVVGEEHNKLEVLKIINRVHKKLLEVDGYKKYNLSP